MTTPTRIELSVDSKLAFVIVAKRVTIGNCSILSFSIEAPHRRVFPKLIANEIVSVQPMSLPSGEYTPLKRPWWKRWLRVA